MPFIGRQGEICGSIDMEGLIESGKSDIIEESSNEDMLEVALDFDSDAILLGYPRYANILSVYSRHHEKVKSSTLPAHVCTLAWFRSFL